jgi:hypothetical protein
MSIQLSTAGFLQVILKDKPIENAQHICVTINKVKVHKASPENFIIVSEEQRELDLLSLKNNPRPIVETNLEAGHYNQIWLSVISGRIVLKVNNRLVEYPMEVPSEDIKIPVQFEVAQKRTTQIILDFDAENSIHAVKAGKSDTYILRPVIIVGKVSDS